MVEEKEYEVVFYLYDLSTTVDASSLEEAVAKAQFENRELLNELYGEWQLGYVNDSDGKELWEEPKPIDFKKIEEEYDKLAKKKTEE